MHRFLEQEVGCNIGMARHSLLVRWKALAVYYQRMAAAIKDVRFVHRRSFIDNDQRRVQPLLRGGNPVEVERPQFVFSTAYDRAQCELLLAVRG